MAGGIAKQLLKNVSIQAYTSSVGTIYLKKPYQDLDLSQVESNEVRCPDVQVAEQMINHIKEIRKHGDTIGGTVTCVIKNVPVGLGEPVFDKLHADLGKAMLSINAVKGFEYGSGFCGTEMKGSEHNDLFSLMAHAAIRWCSWTAGLVPGLVSKWRGAPRRRGFWYGNGF